MEAAMGIITGLLAFVGMVAIVRFGFKAHEAVQDKLNELSSLQWDVRQTQRELSDLKHEVRRIRDGLDELAMEATKDGQG